MSRFVQDTDFEQEPYLIPVNPAQEDDLQAYIEDVERKYIPLLFGKELGDLFILDWDTVPVGPIDPRFVFIYNPFVHQDSQFYLDSEGMKKMFQGLVYYLYTRDRFTRLTTTGGKKTESENSMNVSGLHHDITRRYNESIEIYQTIQTYMDCVDPDLYPEYDGIEQKYNHIF